MVLASCHVVVISALRTVEYFITVAFEEPHYFGNNAAGPSTSASEREEACKALFSHATLVLRTTHSLYFKHNELQYLQINAMLG